MFDLEYHKSIKNNFSNISDRIIYETFKSFNVPKKLIRQTDKAYYISNVFKNPALTNIDINIVLNILFVLPDMYNI